VVADQLPFTVAHLAGAPGAGSSLDNTLRVGPRTVCEWVLLELRPDLGARGYGHGSVWIWSPDGQLLAVGSQTSGMQSAMAFTAEPRPLR
jgi:acyl-CoA thioesterase